MTKYLLRETLPHRRAQIFLRPVTAIQYPANGHQRVAGIAFLSQLESYFKAAFVQFRQSLRVPQTKWVSKIFDGFAGYIFQFFCRLIQLNFPILPLEFLKITMVPGMAAYHITFV